MLRKRKLLTETLNKGKPDYSAEVRDVGYKPWPALGWLLICAYLSKEPLLSEVMKSVAQPPTLIEFFEWIAGFEVVRHLRTDTRSFIFIFQSCIYYNISQISTA